jgi:hypothetical protein
MNFKEFKKEILRSLENGTLITPKHNPNNTNVIYKKDRSVISFDLSKKENLIDFINSDKYSVIQYENINFPASPDYWVIRPFPDSTYFVPASGVPAFSLEPDVSLNCLLAVSGINQGLHLFGESDKEIMGKEASGEIILKNKLI